MMKPDWEGPGREPLARWLADKEAEFKGKQIDRPLRVPLAIARVLLTDPGMSQAWRTLTKMNANGLSVRVCVQNAMTNAGFEFRLQPASEIKRSLERVERLIGELQDAIEHSPLPKNQGTWLEIEHPQVKKSVVVIFGWRDMSDRVDWGFMPVSVVQVLDWAREKLNADRDDLLRPRAVLRRGDNGPADAVRTFAIHLGQLMALPPERQGFNRAPPSVIAAIANAIHRPRPPVGSDQVKEWLKEAPALYVGGKRGSKGKAATP